MAGVLTYMLSKFVRLVLELVNYAVCYSMNDDDFLHGLGTRIWSTLVLIGTA